MADAPEHAEPVEHKHVVVSKKLVAINSASQVGARILNITVLLWAYQYLLKRIPAEEFAILPVVSAIIAMAPVFFSLFIGGVSRYVVDAYARDDKSEVVRIVSSIFPPLAAAAVAFLTLGAIFALNIENILNVAPQMVGDARIMAGLLFASFALQMLAMPFTVGFHVRQRFVELNLIGVGRDCIRIALMLALLLGVGPEVIWVVVATFVSEVAYTIVTFLRSRAMARELQFDPTAWSSKKAKELMNFGLWTTLGRMGAMLYTNAGTIILNIAGTPVDVNAFYIAATLFKQLDSLINLAVAPLEPVVTAMNALKDQKRMTDAMLRAGRYALWAALAVAAPLAIFSGPFVELYAGETYAIAAVAVVILMANFLGTAPTVILAMVSIATTRLKAFFLPAFLMQVAGFGLMLLAAMAFGLGVVGVTLALAAITILGQVAYFWPLHMKWGQFGFTRFARETLIPGAAPALAGGAFWLAAALLFDVRGWLDLILLGVPGGCAYVVALYFALDAKEKRDLGAIVRKFA